MWFSWNVWISILFFVIHVPVLNSHYYCHHFWNGLFLKLVFSVMKWNRFLCIHCFKLVLFLGALFVMAQKNWKRFVMRPLQNTSCPSALLLSTDLRLAKSISMTITCWKMIFPSLSTITSKWRVKKSLHFWICWETR